MLKNTKKFINKFTFFSNLFSGLFVKDNNFILSIFFITNLLILLGLLGSSAKFTVFFFTFLVFIIYLKIRNLALSAFLITVYTLQFYVPNKYYTVEVFRSFEISPGLGNYVLSYGVNLANVFLVLTLIIVVRNITKEFFAFKNVKLPVMPVIIGSSIFYFLISFFSLIQYSPYPNLSLTWLLQFMQLFIIAQLLLYFFHKNRRQTKLVVHALAATLFLQGAVALLQFIHQSWIGLPVESFRVTSVYYGAIDAVDTLFRVAGTFGDPNQLALLTLAIAVIVLAHAFKNKGKIYLVSLSMAVLAIFLSQSRSVWIAFTAVSLITVLFYKNSIAKLIAAIGVRRFIAIGFIIATISAIAVVPRIIKSSNVFYKGAAISLREEMLSEAGQAIALNPWVGYGIGTNEPTLLRLFPSGYNYSFPAPIHTAYVQMVLESGFLGLAAFLFPFLYILRFGIYKLFAGNINKYKNYLYIFLCGVITFAIYYLFQPHEGFREFPYLGIILGYGMIFKNQGGKI